MDLQIDKPTWDERVRLLPSLIFDAVESLRGELQAADLDADERANLCAVLRELIDAVPYD